MEKERYKYFVETNQLYDSEEDELYAYNLNNNKIISTLNQQDKQIKELEAENSKFRKYYQEAMENKRYYVMIDYQGGEFGMGRNYTIKQWKCQAMCWAYTDDNYEIVKEIYNLPDENVIEYISLMWELKFRKTPYNKKLSEDDLKDYEDKTLDEWFNLYYEGDE